MLFKSLHFTTVVNVGFYETFHALPGMYYLCSTYSLNPAKIKKSL